MLTLVPLCLLLFWMLPADSMGAPFDFPPGQTNQDIPLSFVEGSIDDMYNGCQKKMMEKVLKNYLKKELQDQDFKDAWSRAARCARKRPKAEDRALTRAHMRALCVYTSDDVYEKFNEAVRTQGSAYNTTFRFHSLHFLLTSAVQILNRKHLCHTTYRRTRSVFTGRVNETIRFGTFASSSYKKDLIYFGSQTCFKIKTCSGAYLKEYSVYQDHEAEVLIPPYEAFKITRKMTGQGKEKGLQDCKAVYELERTDEESRLNCRNVNPQGQASSASSFRFQEMLPSSVFLTLIALVTLI
ncbi:ecto-ADP-ribosyltransferase 4-like [Halichoeres trimaculatus]|uniref:ecto-ADP-ribosyltransferase 4-like n=1 Tax=Halichoeres trimaculatus TaxID=147232 RepID=UPI003D9F2397